MKINRKQRRSSEGSDPEVTDTVDGSDALADGQIDGVTDDQIDGSSDRRIGGGQIGGDSRIGGGQNGGDGQIGGGQIGGGDNGDLSDPGQDGVDGPRRGGARALSARRTRNGGGDGAGDDGVGDDEAPGGGTIVGDRLVPRAATTIDQPSAQRARPREFVHEVNVELRKVVWPTRHETLNYASVVLVTLAVLMALIFGLDYGFADLSRFLFGT